MPPRKTPPAAASSAPAPIWAKRTSAGPSPRMLAYCAGRDVAPRPAADAVLIPYDLWTNRAHCRMLRRQGIITAADESAILAALATIESEHAAGRWALDPSLEDVHINIERRVAALASEPVAGVMHTARSRNDQTTTDCRLWLRDQLLARLQAVTLAVIALARLARREAATPAPGWTHGQPAMPTTLGHWAAAHGFALARDARALQSLWPFVNNSPLGAAASFGTSWPIDRVLTARLLGFDAPAPNSLDAISSRWEMEARVASVLAILMTHLSSLGQDLIFLSTPPREGLRLSDAHVTGSSIMPNKRNPDFAEITRARALSVHGLAGQLAGVGRGALSGYNRDTQWTKYWIMDALDEVGEAPELFAEVLGSLTVNRPALARAAVDGFSLAADLADRLAQTRKLPFRRAYHIVAEAVAGSPGQPWINQQEFNDVLKREKIEPLFNATEWLETASANRALAQRSSAGGPAPDDVRAQAGALLAEARELAHWADARRRSLEAARRRAAG